MTQTSPAEQPTPATSDAELITRARAGDSAAFGELYERHRGSAMRLARQLVPGTDAEDLVSEAFARVLDVLRSGGGPDVSFRAYLLTTLRRRHYDRVRADRRVQVTDDLTPYDPGVPFGDAVLEGFETSAAARAFASLPERWQAVLWHTEVEGEKPADVAPLLGLSANGVSALAYRAREGLRQAYLQMHLAGTTSDECRWTNQRLGAYTRGALSKRETAAVERHLDDCEACRGVYLELVAVNTTLPALLGPIVLGPLAAAYVGKGAVAGANGLGVLGDLFGRVRDGVRSSPQTAAATAGAGVVAAAAAIALVVLTSDSAPPVKPATPVIAAPAAPAPPPLRLPAAPAPESPVPKSVSAPDSGPGSAAASAPGSAPARAAVAPPPPAAVRARTPAAEPPPEPEPTRQPPAPAPVDAPAPPSPSRPPSPPPSRPPSQQRGIAVEVYAEVDVRVTIDAPA